MAATAMHNAPVVLVLLPGMDGTGKLFKPFVRQLPPRVQVRAVSYPREKEKREKGKGDRRIF
jgi:surfactin synthase thioesterase subunit